jgi:hypothetical protein
MQQQQQHEIADVVAAEGNTSRNRALAAAPLAAGVKAKLPLQQLDVCDTAAAVAGIADNEQQHTQLLQCLPIAESAAATVAAAAGKQPGWLWRVCSRLCSVVWLTAA